jgi:hypothetical protein
VGFRAIAPTFHFKSAYNKNETIHVEDVVWYENGVTPAPLPAVQTDERKAVDAVLCVWACSSAMIQLHPFVEELLGGKFASLMSIMQKSNTNN